MTPARRIKTLFYRLHQQHHRCFYCSGDLTCEKKEPSLDHVRPRSQGRGNQYDEPKNCVACCLECNERKADKRPDEEMLARLENLNQTYSDEKADVHYMMMLRTSRELMKVVGLCGVRN